MRFGTLDFLITEEDELAQAVAPVQPPHHANLDPIIDVPEELQLPALEDHASGSN